MSYSHVVQPAIQIMSTGTQSLTLLNGFMQKNSGAAQYSYQSGLDAFLVKGRNTLEIYVKPKKQGDKNKSLITVSIRVFPEAEGVNGRTHYASHDNVAEDDYDEIFPSSPALGQDIVSVVFGFDHDADKESLSSSVSHEKFSIVAVDGALVKTATPEGFYHVEEIRYVKKENGFFHITADFDLLEDRPYSSIYTADEIAPSDTPRASGELYEKPHATLLDELYAQTREGYEILKQQDWEAWRAYINPVTHRFRENPLFKDIYPPGMSADVQIEAALNNMDCTLDAFPAMDDEDVTPALIFQRKIAVIPNAIYYSSSQFNYSLSIDLYYAYEEKKWVLAHVIVN